MRGQSSAEFLILLAVTLTILVIVFVIAWDQFSSLQLTKGGMEARNSVETLKAAATEVYGQGEGARRLVYIKIPPNYAPNASFVANRTIALKVRENDIASTTDFDVYGSLPGTEGGHFVWVISEGNRVRIGNIFLFVDKNSVLVQMLQTQTKGDNFTVQNIGDKPINVTLTPSWTHSPVVNLTLSDTNFSLGPGDSQTVEVEFTSSSSAAGDYTGTLEVFGDDGDIQETFPLLLDADVLVPDVQANISNVSGVGVIGHIWYQAVPRNQSASRTFSICSLPNISVTTLTFTGTGTAGAWLQNTTAGPLPPDSCLNHMLTLNVPAGAALGNNTGTIEISGDGIYNDTIIVIINVLPMDTQPPVITNMSRSPQPAFVHQFLTINLSVTDVNTGNSNIKYCEIKIDNGTLQNMTAVDGIFDSPRENASISYAPYFIRAGNHTASARCADAGGNLGNFTNLSFVMHKEILVVFKDDEPEEDEALWVYFLSFQTSQLGYAWSYDMAFADDVNSGAIALNAYATLLYGDYEEGVGNDDTVRAFNSSGKATMLFSDALKEGPRELGLTNNRGVSQSPTTTM
ncbi:MAG: hypothetical protein AB1529_07335, partial [Candidatus Micrarchaeota archaeon]